MKRLNNIHQLVSIILLVPSALFAGIFDNLQPTLIATGMQFTEGPVWHPDGYLVFSDITGNKIFKWSEDKGLSVLATAAGNPNGIACTKTNSFYVCRQGSRDIAKMDTLGNLTSFLSKFNGKRFNSPNDLTLSYLESIYFTDPDFGATARELTYQGLFCIPFNSTTPVLLDSLINKHFFN